MSRLLITGGSGYLGGWLRQAAAAGWEVSATYFSRRPPPFGSVADVPLDLTKPAAVERLVAEARPAAIIHTACSNRDAASQAAILPAARHLARAARQHGTRLIHVSTDMVFDGEHAPYPDEAAPAPITDYGRAKAEAEAAVRDLCPTAAIVRPSLIWALEPCDRQTAWLLAGLDHAQRVTLFNDEMRCPVFLPDLAAALLELAARPDLTGSLNLAGPQALSRWDFGLRLLQALGRPRPPTLVPGAVAASGVVRPRDLRLLSRRAQAALGARLRPVDEVLGAPSRSRRPRYCEG